MRILAIGGSGSMARYAMRATQNFSAVDEIVIADINKEAANSFASTLNNKVSAIQLDVTDSKALKNSMKGVDTVVNTCGPFFKFGTPILSTAISSGCNYVDICDDWEPTLDMLNLDSAAKSAGISATIGLGASPGLTNLMALIAIRELDSVSKVFTGWDAGGTSIDETAKKQSVNAAMMHAVEQITGKVKIYQDSTYKMVKPLKSIDVNYPGLTTFTGNIIGHPEALTFPHYFKDLKDSINLAHGGSVGSFVLKAIAELVNVGLLSKNKAANVFAWLENQGSSERNLSSNYLPVIYGYANGLKNGDPASVGVCLSNEQRNSASTNNYDAIGMGEITGIPLACGIKMLAEGKINKSGVFSPEAGHIDPHDFITDVLDELSEAINKPLGNFEENIRINRSWE